MSKIQKLFTVLSSLIMIAIGIIVLLVPTDVSFAIIAIIIGVCITIRALKDFIYYLASARHMIGGKKILIDSVLEFEFGLLSFLVLLKRPIIAMLYLVAIFIVLGLIDILRGLEIKRNEGKKWQFKIVMGIIAIGLGVACLVLGVMNTISRSREFVDIMAGIFSIAWIIKGVFGVISSFYKTSIVYVEDQTVL